MDDGMPTLTLSGGVVRVTPPRVPSALIQGPVTPGVVVVPAMGPPGPAGPAGPKGDQGDVSATFSYEHSQSIAQSVWQVTHNLNRHPIAWSLYDTDSRLCDNYEVQHLTLNTLRVSMDVPTAGLARFI